MLVTYTGVSGPGDAPGGDYVAFVWQTDTGELLYTLDHSGIDNVVVGASWSPDSRMIVTVGQAGETRIWDTSTGVLLHAVEEGRLEVGSTLWSADGQRLIFTEKETGQLLLWDSETGNSTSLGFHAPDLGSFANRTYVSDTPDGGFLIWDADSGTPTYHFRATHTLGHLAWTPDLQILGVIPVPQYIKRYPAIFWDVNTYMPRDSSELAGPVQNWIATALQAQDEMRYCLHGDPIYDEGSNLHISYASEEVDDPAFSQGRIDSTITVLNLETYEVIHEFVEEASSICTMAVSPDGALLAIGHRPHNQGQGQPTVTDIDANRITVWDLETGNLVHTFYGGTGKVDEVLWSPDASRLVSRSWDGTIIIWGVSQ